MSRGGRGGFGGAQNKYPFDIDPDLEKDIAAFANDGGVKGKKEDDPSSLFPPYPGGVPRAPPPTKYEKRRVAVARQIIAARHADKMAYFGPPGTMEREFGKKRSAAAEFDAFSDQQTYSKKFQKDDFRMPTDDAFKNYPWACPQYFPKELWDVMGYDPNKASDPNAPARRLPIPLKTVDKLARFDDEADDTAAPDADDANDEAKADGEEAEEAEPQDDDFEDDEDDGDDYNAEQYFDVGDDDYDEGGDDGYADEGY